MDLCFQPTGQQQAVIDACASGASVVIEAGAGTGKTSVLRLAALAMPRQHGVYVAYNRATAEAARRVFPAHVQCVTAHAQAYRAVGYQYAARLPDHSGRLPAWAVANMLGVGQPLLLGRDLLLTPAHLARIALGTMERYCYSADEHISGRHVPTVNGLDPPAQAELTWRVVPWAERAWHDIRSLDGKLPVRHDHYLKMWQLSRPVIPAGFIMFDEAQDANPVTAFVVQDQNSAQVIAVGDSCQAIYGWRGAVDALTTWPAEYRLHLTQSFRFGPTVAAEANKWLRLLDAPFQLTGTSGVVSVVGSVSEPHAILCRTNAEALQQARAALDAGRRVTLAGGGEEIRQLALAALDLQASGRTSNPELAAFTSWHAVQDFVRTDSAGADLAASVRLIDKHGAADVLRITEHLSRQRDADLTVSTAHRAKGLEWGRVLVAGDFREPSRGRTGQDGAISRAEAMLGYVTVTRARHALDRAGLAWIDGRAGSGPRVAVASTASALSLPATGDGYPGGRAEAETGSLLVEDAYRYWRTVAVEPYRSADGHPHARQLSIAWHAASRQGLGDDPGPAAIRYGVLARAACMLHGDLLADGLHREASAISAVAEHAAEHGQRLYQASIDLFTRSAKAAPYADRAQAAAGSRIIENDYRAWASHPAAVVADGAGVLWEWDAMLSQAWAGIEQHGLADGPGQAAARYRQIAGLARNLAGDPPTGMAAAALAPVLQLALHADKHAIRLDATAAASADSTVAGIAARAHAIVPRAATQPAPTAAGGARAPAPAGLGEDERYHDYAAH